MCHKHFGGSNNNNNNNNSNDKIKNVVKMDDIGNHHISVNSAVNNKNKRYRRIINENAEEIEVSLSDDLIVKNQTYLLCFILF